jgi:gluconolactonase
MAATEVIPASRIPGPPELLPGRPDAVVDLQTHEGAALVGARWRTAEARVVEIDFVGPGDDLGPSGPPNRTYDLAPHAEAADFDDSGWRVLEPPETELRLGTGKVSFVWYRLDVTIPERIGDLDMIGTTVVLEIVVDDYAEVWVDGQLPLALGETGGQVVGGFNAPNRVVLTQDARPGKRHTIAVLGINGPISVAPMNYVWFRSATLDVYTAERARVGEDAELNVDRIDPALDAVVPGEIRLERVAGGFEFTEGPVWSKEGALLFSSPNTNVIYRWTPEGRVSVFRAKSGYRGTDIARYFQPGSNGLTFDPQGRLTMCQHGERRILRVEPRGNTTVLADRFEGRRLNSPNDLVYRSDGTLYFTDPAFGLPEQTDDPKKELPFTGVFRVSPDGEVTLVDDELSGPNGIALSPDERFLYVGNWDFDRSVVKRYEVASDSSVSGGAVFFDMTGAPGEDSIDGVKVDREGNLYVCGPGGIWVLSPDARHLGTLRLPENPHNLAWGDHDGRTLYVTALTSIYRMRLSIPGVRPA